MSRSCIANSPSRTGQIGTGTTCVVVGDAGNGETLLVLLESSFVAVSNLRLRVVVDPLAVAGILPVLLVLLLVLLTGQEAAANLTAESDACMASIASRYRPSSSSATPTLFRFKAEAILCVVVAAVGDTGIEEDMVLTGYMLNGSM